MTDLIYRKAADLADKSEDPKLRAVAERLDLTVAALYREVSQLKNRLALIEQVKAQCCLENTGTTTIGTSSSVTLTWDTVHWDNDNMSIHSSDDRMIINTPGYYALVVKIKTANPSGGGTPHVNLIIRVNGSNIICRNRAFINPTAGTSVMATIVHKLNKNDYVQVEVDNASTTTSYDIVKTADFDVSFRASMIERIYNPDDIPNRYE